MKKKLRINPLTTHAKMERTNFAAFSLMQGFFKISYQHIETGRIFLFVQKSKSRKVVTFHIGEFIAKETVLYCSAHCRKTFHCKELNKFVAPGCNFGYDIIEYIGRAVWLESKTAENIKSELACLNVSISEEEISYLAKKFVIYVADLHKDQQETSLETPSKTQLFHRSEINILMAIIFSSRNL